MSKFNNILAITMILLFTFAACEKNLFTENKAPLSQFAERVINFSSEYTEAPGPWSSFVILGNPDTYPEYGDIQTAWAPKSPNAKAEYITVGFSRKQYVNSIKIYETYNPGAVVEVQIHNAESDNWEVVFSEEPILDLPKESRINNISFPMTNYLVDQLKIIMQTQKVTGWNEIDAVEISGVIRE
jgi:hypothetical protein